jgi:hypothetical protein
MQFLQRLNTLIRVELGHALLGKLEEHRLGPKSLTKYEGPIEALKVLRKEREALLHYQCDGKPCEHLYEPWKPMNFSKKRWRKDSQLFI